MIHYFTHHGNIKKGTWLDNVRRYHVAHHFNDPDAGLLITFFKYLQPNIFLEAVIYIFVSFNSQVQNRLKISDEFLIQKSIKFVRSAKNFS